MLMRPRKECIKSPSDLATVECLTFPYYEEAQLWEEVMKDSAHKTPEERLAALLESLKPSCTQEELESCRQEALSILEKSAFRSARQYAVSMHDDFRLRARARETEASESTKSPQGTDDNGPRS